MADKAGGILAGQAEILAAVNASGGGGNSEVWRNLKREDGTRVYTAVVYDMDAVCVDEDSGTYVVIYRNNQSYLYVTLAQRAGDTWRFKSSPTYCTPVTGSGSRIHVVKVKGATEAAILYMDTGSYLRVYHIYNISLTAMTMTVSSNSSTGIVGSVAYDGSICSPSNGVICVIGGHDPNAQLRARAATVSGGTITWGTVSTVDAASTYYYQRSITSPTDNLVVATYSSSGDGFVYMKACILTGTAFGTWQTAVKIVKVYAAQKVSDSCSLDSSTILALTTRINQGHDLLHVATVDATGVIEYKGHIHPNGIGAMTQNATARIKRISDTQAIMVHNTYNHAYVYPTIRTADVDLSTYKISVGAPFITGKLMGSYLRCSSVAVGGYGEIIAVQRNENDSSYPWIQGFRLTPGPGTPNIIGPTYYGYAVSQEVAVVSSASYDTFGSWTTLIAVVPTGMALYELRQRSKTMYDSDNVLELAYGAAGYEMTFARIEYAYNQTANGIGSQLPIILKKPIPLPLGARISARLAVSSVSGGAVTAYITPNCITGVQE